MRARCVGIGMLVLILPWVAVVAQHPPEARTVELILDASGSMNARLSDGTTRLDAARAALAQLVKSLPSDTVIAFRVYGAVSPRERHDCADTQLLVPFGPVAPEKIIAAARALKAQGYTPISKVLELAAADFPPTSRQRTIVLVSDGHETCDGDPCATAQALARSQVKTVVHVVGFGADEAAVAQLRCLASVSGGQYWNADDAAQLAAALAQAVVAEAGTTPQAKGKGLLGVRGADLHGCRVLDAASGQEVGRLDYLRQSMEVPAGVYNVTFGPSVWKSVLVRPHEETWLEPAVLTIENASLAGHQVLDPETGEAVAEVSLTNATVAVIPGRYDITFGEALWQGVVLEKGKHKILRPGLLTVRGATIDGHVIRDMAGREVSTVSATGNTVALPPGTYTITLTNGVRTVSLGEGTRVVVENR